MMPIEGSRGFSLIELLIALSIIALMATVTTPRLAGLVDSIEFDADINQLVSKINSLPLQATINKQTMKIDPESFLNNLHRDKSSLSYGNGPTPKRYSVSGGAITSLSTGVCQTASLTVTTQSGRSRVINVSSPNCETTLVNQG